MLDRDAAHAILMWMHGDESPLRLNGGTVLALLTVVGDAAVPGTEVVSGGGYTAGPGGRIPVTWGVPADQSTATAVVAQVTNYPRDENVAGIEVYEAGEPYRRIEYGVLTGGVKAMAVGDTLSFVTGSITSSLA